MYLLYSQTNTPLHKIYYTNLALFDNISLTLRRSLVAHASGLQRRIVTTRAYQRELVCVHVTQAPLRQRKVEMPAI